MLRQPAVRRLARPSAPGALRGRTFILRSRPSQSSPSGRPLEGLNIRRLAEERADWERTRRNFLLAGIVAGCVSFAYTAWKLKEALSTPTRLDSALPPSDPLVAGGIDGRRKVVIHDAEGRELVPTGNATVPHFPRTLDLPATFASASAPSATSPTTGYTLVGLGVRTVSFLSIQVYVVGYYVATADIAALQARLVHTVDPVATALVPGERDQLRARLLDPDAGEALWEGLLREGVPARSAFRVVPVRDTDFHHLRDGFVRAIQARGARLEAEGGGSGSGGGGGGHDFGEAMRDFRQLFNRGKVPKKQELLLVRDGRGGLTVAYDEGTGRGCELVGTVADERVSRALWLNYLAGKKVASEPARESIVDGVMEFVERPIGTVAAQVV